MAFLFSFAMLFFSPVGSAQECSCPVVQCDPCQRRIVLDSQKIMCTAEKSVVCENVVCENVDNYFQCQQGAAAQYVPPEDPYERMTDPRMPAMSNPQAPITFPDMELKDFQHFNHIDTTISAEEKPGIGVRGPASKILKPKAGEKTEVAKPTVEDDMSYPWLIAKDEKVAPIVFSGLYNATIDGQRLKPVKKHNLNGASGVLAAKQKQVFWMDYGKTRARVQMSENSEIRFSKEDQYLVLYPVRGKIWIRDITATDMIVIDAGEWRIGKSKGDVRWSLKDGDSVIYNARESALLRRDQLIAKSEPVDGGTELIISADYGIVHADHDVPPKDKEFRLMEDGGKVNTRRVLASSTIAQEGCAQPQGNVQQCAWKCFGAKGKGKACENSESTQCVRFTCSMGGEWKLPTRVPGRECKANSITVNSCN